MSKTISQSKPPYLGFGVGLRTEHYETIVNEWPEVDWFEALSENYMVLGGKPLHYLDRIRARYPVVMHGVSLPIGGTDPLDRDYLKQLKSLADGIEPTWISGHLVLHRAARQEFARSVASALYRRSDRACIRTYRAGARCFRSTDRAGECLQLYDLHAIDDH